jgi:hypothetical protein
MYLLPQQNHDLRAYILLVLLVDEMESEHRTGPLTLVISGVGIQARDKRISTGPISRRLLDSVSSSGTCSRITAFLFIR